LEKSDFSTTWKKSDFLEKSDFSTSTGFVNKMTIDYHAPFVSNDFYHVYNRANTNTDKLFYQQKNYAYFLQKFNEYLSDYLEVWAYCLIPNHFHFLVRVKALDDVALNNSINAAKSIDTVALSQSLNAVQNIDIVALSNNINKIKGIEPTVLIDNLNAIKKIDTAVLVKSINAIKNIDDVNAIIEEQFRKFFLGYAKAINKQEARRGSLFQSKFKRILVDNDSYLMTLIHYIHHNPIHHNLTADMQNWLYNSYNALITQADTKLMRKEVLELFGNREKLIESHQMMTDYDKITRYIIED
jgi:putative transposase